MSLLLIAPLLALAADLPSLDTPVRTAASTPADAAVVIGIEDYVFVADVPYAKRDARSFYDFLVYTRGVPADHVRLFEGSAGREQILEALDTAAGQVGSGGSLWVYFAGHGAADTSSGQRLLLGDDVRQDPAAFATRGVGLDELRTRAGGVSVHLVVDACYNGLGRNGDELVAGKRFVVPVQAMRPTDSAALEWTAASGDELSGPLHATQHGAFTYFALGALRGWADGERDGVRDGKVTAEEADLYVKRALRTVQITDQHPVLTTAAPSSLVLSAGTEEGPTLAPLTAATPAVASAAPGVLDAGDAALMDGVLQGIVDTCTAQHQSASAAQDVWTVRFKPKKGVAKGLWMSDGNASATDDAMGTAEMEPAKGSRAMCITREIKALKFTESSVVVSRTLRPTP